MLLRRRAEVQAVLKDATHPAVKRTLSITLEDVEELTVQHFHIRWSRWSDETLDWEPYSKRGEAEARAIQLKRTGERYRIEQFDGDCQRCNEVRKPGAKA